jgi:uncharacterized protein (DUF1697 family)
MSTYISLLRGINVSGKNMIKMPDLLKVLEKEGFSSVSTYIQSGNIIFDYQESPCNSIVHLIEEVILRNFGLTVPVQVLTVEDFTEVVSSNPFLKRSGINIEKLHTTFLAEKPSKLNVEKLLTYSFLPDEIVISGKAVYLYLPNGYGRTKFNNTFIENKLATEATTRNWRTCVKLMELCAG